METMINKSKYIFISALAALFLSACTDENEIMPDTKHGEEFSVQGVIGEVSTRAMEDYYIGRNVFIENDKMVITKMQRTTNPITAFSYSNLKYISSASQSWSRDREENGPERIYWSDNETPHTIIGYSTPLAWNGNLSEKWTTTTETVTDTEGNLTQIDFYKGYFSSTTEGEQSLIDFSSRDNIKAEDLLLTYSTNMQAETGGSVAIVHFKHALASVKVIVNILGFAATATSHDASTVVTDLRLLNQPYKYKWNQLNVETLPVEPEATKTIKTWSFYPTGDGTGRNKTFTFASLAVPGTRNTSMSFQVTYPDAHNPSTTKTHTYVASIDNVLFRSGYCTTIRISLNHENEEITIGAEYIDWENEEIPDDSELSKNNTYLQSTVRTDITIIGDEKATIDDATWLYMDGSTIKDIYGNTGGKNDPFTIKTAEQLLSFAYEVKEGNNGAGRNFNGQYVKLDADITLQKETDKTKQEGNTSSTASDALSWIGIGASGKPFNGYFDGGSRMINRLYGSPLFYEIGANAHVGQLTLKDAIEISGNGGFAEINNGTICACEFDGNVIERSHQEPVGSIVGTNNGLIFACYHIGDLTATNASVVGGLVGRNGANGKIVASYNYGKITTNVVAGVQNAWKYGILGENLAASASIFGCFYDKTQAEAGGSHVSNVAPETAISSDYPSEPKTTTQMIVYSFVGDKDATVQRYTTLGEVNNYNASLQGAVKVGDALEYSVDQLRNLTNVEISKDMFDFFNHFGVGFWYEEYTSTLPEFKPDFERLSNEDIITLLTALKERCKHNEVSANAFNAKLPGAKKIGDIKDLSLNAIINSWTAEYGSAIEEVYGVGWKTHFANHYYLAHPASYPYVY